MTWHSTPESAVGLHHPCDVERRLVNPIIGFHWYVSCENCGPVYSPYGYSNEDTAQRLAERHEREYSAVVPVPTDAELDREREGSSHGQD